MEILLCTIGFAGKSAEEFFELLRAARVEKVIDIRQHREGQLSGFAKHPDLAFFLEKVARIGYSHETQLAPTSELLKTYRETKNWPAYETGFLALMKERGIPQGFNAAAWPSRAALLCSEPGPEKCHRRLAADLLAAHWRAQGHLVEIRHLVAARAKASKARRKKPPSVP
ncbi:MAG TPA: DUF488 domain-containing protein [Candidatus Acidoferrum sp.]|nr:DUF488 domain-containing protein [Candidatus Acidoferrum sp.]